MEPNISLITLVNNKELYDLSRYSIKRQNKRIEFIEINADKNKWNAAKGLNHGISLAKGDWIICSHQDVIFPPGWYKRLLNNIKKINKDVAIIGLVGIKKNGKFRGRIFDPNGVCYWGPLPDYVLNIDEHVIIIKKSSKLKFDEKNPGFHCYGTDISLEAARKGLKVVVIDNPIIHLSTGKIDKSFKKSAKWLLDKWGHLFDDIIPTCAKIIYNRKMNNLKKYLKLKLKRKKDIKKRGRNTKNIL